MVCDPVGLSEVADRLGYDRQTVKNWRLAKELAPKWTISGGPAWNWPDVVRWAKRTGKAGRMAEGA